MAFAETFKAISDPVRRQILELSLVTILPVVIGILFWNRLPDMMATHFGFDNEANGFSFGEDPDVGIYGFDSRIPVGIYGGDCRIDFGEITKNLKMAARIVGNLDCRRPTDMTMHPLTGSNIEKRSCR